MTRVARVQRLSMRGPDDVAPLVRAIEAGRIAPDRIVAILGKTEGNGCVNDFTRAFAVSALTAALAPHLPAGGTGRIAMVMSGGTEGALAPHMLVLEALDLDAPPAAAGALALGSSRTPALDPADLGRAGQVASVAAGVREAMRAAGIEDPADVHFVQIKCPLLTSDRIAAARSAGHTVATTDTLKSMGLSRGASALGVALALGEISGESAAGAHIGADPDLWSSRASTSAGVELDDHEIVVLGMSRHWGGSLAIDHAVMTDQIDVRPVADAARRLGFSATSPIPADERGRLVALLAKAEAGTTGTLRGPRHTMLDDSDLSATRHARAFVAGALAGLVGHAEIFVSGGAEHQGPDGGGPVALIARRETP